MNQPTNQRGTTMDRCSGTFTHDCTGEIAGFFSLDLGGHNRAVRGLCGACTAVATRLGYDPQRVQEWVGRAAIAQLPTRIAGGVAA